MKERAAYRADIDGLRAVAVVSVLLFHLHVPGWSGGYVGVDVFFVISGYLITSFIHAEISNASFSLREFYLRRVRRLAPSLLLVSVPVTVCAWLMLYPEDLRSFAASLGIQFTALQNVAFLSEGEYFRGSETKPLLHTWSLAVEEQFYLVWPLLLLATRRLSFALRMALIGILLAGSFALNLMLFAFSPKASFFLLPPRAWELGVGGLVALSEHQRLFAGWLTDRWRTVLGVAGLSGILGAVIGFSDTTPFPGTAALLPVLGSALVIVAGVGGASLPGRLLSRPALVHVGLISYPLYLWHWPLIAFCHYAHLDPASWPNALAILAASVLLAEVSYRFVETPIRTRRWLPTAGALVTASGTTAAVLTAFAVHLYVTDGAAYRFHGIGRALLTAPFHARSDRCGFLFRVMNARAQVCPLHEEPSAKRRVLLWGNSHADMWSGLFTELARQHGASVFLNARNCRATRDSAFCGARVQDEVIRFISSERVTDVVLASAWYGLYGVEDEVLERELLRLMGKLAELDVRVWLVIDTPAAPEFHPINAFEKSPASPEFGSIPLSRFLQRKQQEVAFFSLVAERHQNVNVVDPSGGLCDASRCYAGKVDMAWYRDNSHLTDAGARTATDQFLPLFVR